MARVIWVALQNREGPVDLLQENHPREFVRHRHLSEGDRVLRCGPCLRGETVGSPDRKDQRQGIAILTVSEELGELFGRKFLAPRIHQNQSRLRRGLVAALA